MSTSTTFEELYRRVLHALGETSGQAMLVAKEGVNAGVIMAGLLYEPVELQSVEDLTATSAQDFVLTSGLTRMSRITKVYNETGAIRCWPVPYHLRDVYWLPITGSVQFWSHHGANLYYNPTPSGDETLNVSHIQYPEVLSADDDTFPFDTLEQFVLSVAREYAKVSLQESDTGEAWDRLLKKFAMAETVSIKAQKLLAAGEEVPVANNL